MNRASQGSIVILGGFISRASFYDGMKNQLRSLTGQDVIIAKISPWIWLSVSFPYGWIPILKKLEQLIRAVLVRDPSQRLTLVGHSLGGLLGYLYLLSPAVSGLDLTGRDFIGHLVTLGSPHHNQCRWLHGGLLSKYTKQREKRYQPPKNLRITCVASRNVQGNPQGTSSQKKAFAMYKKIVGQGAVWGDGVIPISAALLPEAQQLILDNVGHFSRSRDTWYGSPEATAQWWAKISSYGTKGTSVSI
jgi:hypothetical protein